MIALLPLIVGLPILIGWPLSDARTWGPRVIRSYWLGLALLTACVFAVNQLGNVTLTPLLYTVAGTLLATITWLARAPKEPSREETAAAKSQGWRMQSVFLLALLILVHRHAHEFFAPMGDYDALYYHLPLAESVMQGDFARDLRFDSLRMVAAYPPLQFFVYGTLGWAITPLHAVPKLFVLWLNLSLFVLLFDFARSRGMSSRQGPWLALVLALALHPVAMSQGLTAVYLVLGITLTLQASSSRHAFIAGIAFSGCLWANYLGFVFLGLATLWALLCWRTGDRRLLQVTCWALLGWTPFLLRNLLVTGNPLFPALTSIFGGPGVSEWALHHEITKPTRLQLKQVAVVFGSMCWPLPIAALLPLIRGKERHCWQILFFGTLLATLTVLLRAATPHWRYWYPLALLTLALWAAAMSRDEIRRGAWGWIAGLCLLVLLVPSQPAMGTLAQAGFAVSFLVLSVSASVSGPARQPISVWCGVVILLVLAHHQGATPDLVKALPPLALLAGFGSLGLWLCQHKWQRSKEVHCFPWHLC